MFNGTQLRESLVLKWQNDDIRAKLEAAWRSWDADAYAAATEQAMTELRHTFVQKPFSDTLIFTTYDLPRSFDDMVGWMTVVVAGDGSQDAVPAELRRDAVVATIKKLVPAMDGHESTEQMMKTVILPFRAFVIAQVVGIAMERALVGQDATVDVDPTSRVALETAKQTDEDAAASTTSSGTAKAEKTAPVKRPAKAGKRTPLTAAQRHALGHVAGGEDDVRAIDGWNERPDLKALRAARAAAVKAKQVHRYIDYCLAFLELADDAPDSVLMAQLEPLADAGLAFAQHDLGVLLLKQADPNTDEDLAALVERGKARGGATMADDEVRAIDLLTRAASIGHTKARVALGKWHAERAGSIIRAVIRGKPGFTEKLPPRAKKTAAATPAAGIAWNQAVKYHAKQAATAVEDLADGQCKPWDEATAEDADEAKTVLSHTEKLRLAAKGLRRDDGGVQKWVDRTLGKDGYVVTMMKGWRVLLIASLIVAVFAAYIVYNKERGTCSMRTEIPIREKLRTKK